MLTAKTFIGKDAPCFGGACTVSGETALQADCGGCDTHRLQIDTYSNKNSSMKRKIWGATPHWLSSDSYSSRVEH